MIETVLEEEERGTRRKEGRGGKSDEEERAINGTTAWLAAMNMTTHLYTFYTYIVIYTKRTVLHNNSTYPA